MVKWAILELRYYLLGRSFTLITDHMPLQWMTKDTNARVTSWILALQDFNFKVTPELPTGYPGCGLAGQVCQATLRFCKYLINKKY
ncbi:MAG: hypothetical protein ACRC9V_03365 [Aeromonas sp.]